MALVRLTVVANDLEASVLCGMLRSHGIESEFRKTNMAGGVTEGAISPIGPTEVLVESTQLQAARELYLDTQ